MPSQPPATARPGGAEIVRNAEALLARREHAEALRVVNDGLRSDPSEPALRALQRQIQADARRAASEAAASIKGARSGAEKAQAADLAPRTFQQARELEAEAGRLFDRQLWAEALAKCLEAVRAYEGAESQAHAENTRLEFEAKERTAESEQARRAADAAAAQRNAAPGSLSSSPAASASPQDDRMAILSVLKDYTAAMQAKDLVALKAVWPSLAGAQETKVRSGFEFARSLRVQLDVTNVQVSGDQAVVSCRRKDTVVTLEGQTVQGDRAAVIRLVKNSNGWSIAAIQ